MQRDFEAKRRTELEAFSGYIVKEAEKQGMAVPIHQFCYDMLLPQEIRAQNQSTHSSKNA